MVDRITTTTMRLILSLLNQEFALRQCISRARIEVALLLLLLNRKHLLNLFTRLLSWLVGWGYYTNNL